MATRSSLPSVARFGESPGRNVGELTIATNDAQVTAPWQSSEMLRQARTDMSAPTLGRYLRRVREAHSVPVLVSLANEIVGRFPDDEAAARLIAVIAIKMARLAWLDFAVRWSESGHVREVDS